MLLASVTFFACAFPVGFAWFFVWRFAAGVSGGALTLLAAPTVLSQVTPSRRALPEAPSSWASASALSPRVLSCLICCGLDCVKRGSVLARSPSSSRPLPGRGGGRVRDNKSRGWEFLKPWELTRVPF